jgi:hypothetical protein
MDDETHQGWLRATASTVVRLALYPAIFILLYALSQGPVAYFHNKSIGAGSAGYAPVMRVVYAPVRRIERWMPFYHDYMNWWISP